MPELSIVIVNFNNFRVLEACLPAVRKAVEGIDAEVILSDNGSVDGSLAWVAANFPEVRILENRANLGFAEANNRAFPLAEGRYILLLNPDTVTTEGAFRAMLAFMEAHPAVGALGCKLLNGDGSRQISARSFPTVGSYFWSGVGLAWRRPQSRTFGRFNLTYWDGESDRCVDWVSGAALMIRREVLERVGAIDPYFFLTYDEVDWCHRIKKAGFEVWYTPDAVITHLDRQSEPQANPNPTSRIKYMTVERNSRVRYFVKHRGVLYAAMVEAVHVALAAAFLVKAAVLGTKQPPVAVMEKRLTLTINARTLMRIPRVLWDRMKLLVAGPERAAGLTLFVNPYLTHER